MRGGVLIEYRDEKEDQNESDRVGFFLQVIREFNKSNEEYRFSSQCQSLYYDCYKK